MSFINTLSVYNLFLLFYKRYMKVANYDLVQKVATNCFLQCMIQVPGPQKSLSAQLTHYYFLTVCSVVVCCWWDDMFFSLGWFVKTNSQRRNWHSRLWTIVFPQVNMLTSGCCSCSLRWSTVIDRVAKQRHGNPAAGSPGACLLPLKNLWDALVVKSSSGGWVTATATTEDRQGDWTGWCVGVKRSDCY